VPPLTYKAIIAYDGTDFLGYQIQASGRTVQGEIEAALKTVTQTPIRTLAAGRTDSGVHATGQVISFTANWKHGTDALQRALRANLPQDIVVKTLTTTNTGFHPRFDAKSRQYRYTIINQPLPDVLRRRYALHIAQPLDVDRMQAASQLLLGTHDFAAFGRPPQGDNTVRTITQAEWRTHNTDVYFYITANAFLYRMVRRIVGTLLPVGLGEMNVEDVKTILKTKDRAKAGAPSAACGLCLINVMY